MATASISVPIVPSQPWLKYAAIGAMTAAAMSFVVYRAGAAVAYCVAALLVFYLCGKPLLGMCVAAMAPISGWCLHLATGLLPYTHDAALWKIDTALGSNPVVLMNLFAFSHPVNIVAAHVYMALPLGIALGCAFSEKPSLFLGRVGAAICFGFLLYFIVPACGPLYQLTGLANAPRNAMPSLHTTWALLIFLEMRQSNLAARIAADAFLVFTLIATVGSGEHYVIDLIAAVPFCLFLQWLFPVTSRTYSFHRPPLSQS